MGFRDQVNEFNQKVNAFFTFVGNRLRNFPDLSKGEQISYPAIGLGLLLIMIGVILFII